MTDVEVAGTHVLHARLHDVLGHPGGVGGDLVGGDGRGGHGGVARQQAGGQKCGGGHTVIHVRTVSQ